MFRLCFITILLLIKEIGKLPISCNVWNLYRPAIVFRLENTFRTSQAEKQFVQEEIIYPGKVSELKPLRKLPKKTEKPRKNPVSFQFDHCHYETQNPLEKRSKKSSDFKMPS